MPSPIRHCSDCNSGYRAPKLKGCPRCERSLERDSRKTRPMLTLRAYTAEIDAESPVMAYPMAIQERARTVSKLMSDIDRIRKVSGWPVAIERRGIEIGVTDRDGIPRSKREGRFVAEFTKPHWKDIKAVLYPEGA